MLLARSRLPQPLSLSPSYGLLVALLAPLEVTLVRNPALRTAPEHSAVGPAALELLASERTGFEKLRGLKEELADEMDMHQHLL